MDSRGFSEKQERAEEKRGNSEHAAGLARSEHSVLSKAYRRYPDELRQLFIRQASLYTMGESGSIPAETAGRLLESIRFTLELVEKKTNGHKQCAGPAAEPEDLFSDRPA
jgi:hypothetical protein